MRCWKMSQTHYRSCAIAEVLLRRSRLPEISQFLKIGDGYVIELKRCLHAMSFLERDICNLIILYIILYMIYTVKHTLHKLLLPANVQSLYSPMKLFAGSPYECVDNSKCTSHHCSSTQEPRCVHTRCTCIGKSF